MLNDNKNENMIFKLILKISQFRLKRNFNRKFKNLEKTLSLIHDANSFTLNNKLVYHNTIWNFAGFVNICSYDLAVAGYEMLFTNHHWKRVYFARQAALIIFEASEDIPQLMGRKLRTAISTLPNSQSLIAELNQINANFTDYKREKRASLERIRHFTIGHRDHDMEDVMEIILNNLPPKN
ncbi:hypothetical protein [Leptospira sp. GIMC2001]|uniref:hypothetical protein n=1 Tax=Leptospira sp. GIMC2001 TaxID=1513297 RepID=UPI00234955A4|nr:hypothetical protein [Leptospira sp. GIMC2001]WCL50658.1 hypothetical protein O4O04_07570 [Leptospira sp. GIMC2001]WCL50800.1 hypothetical protein O4O04_08305 [Leptospira sp. GIMC2001]